MATIRKNRSTVTQANSSQTSAAIEMHLVHLGADRSLHEGQRDCKHGRESCV